MNLLGFLTFLFAGFTLINRTLEGVLIASSDTTILSSLYIFQPVQVLWFTVPVPNFAFFTEGIPHLMKMDYSFLSGGAQLFTYFFYVFTAMMAFVIVIAFLGIAAQKLTAH